MGLHGVTCYELELNDPFDTKEEYELFVMGLHGITCHYLELEEIKDMNSFHNCMISTMFKAKQYWLSV